MTDTTAAPRGTTPPRVRAALIATVVVLGTVGGGLWASRTIWPPLGPGPLLGTHDEMLSGSLFADDTGMLWGSLLLHNSTKTDLTIDSVAIADNPDGLTPTASYMWAMDRVKLLGTGSVSMYQLPLPAKWKIPPRHAVTGFVIPPHTEEESVEVVYEFPVPQHAVTVSGVTVRYHNAEHSYQNTYTISFTICPVTDKQPCD